MAGQTTFGYVGDVIGLEGKLATNDPNHRIFSFNLEGSNPLSGAKALAKGTTDKRVKLISSSSDIFLGFSMHNEYSTGSIGFDDWHSSEVYYDVGSLTPTITQGIFYVFSNTIVNAYSDSVYIQMVENGTKIQGRVGSESDGDNTKKINARFLKSTSSASELTILELFPQI